MSQLVTIWHDASATALAKTPDQLVVDGRHVLKDANVVDSGAQGLVFFLQGMAEAVRGELVYGDDYLGTVMDSGDVAENTFGDHDYHDAGHDGDLEFAYCTECVMQIDQSADQTEAKTKITEAISGIGNSIVSVVSEVGKSDAGAPLLLAKVHVHTNDPELAFSLLRPMCCNRVLIKQKAESMAEQIKMNALDPLPSSVDADVSFVMPDAIMMPETFKSQPALRRHLVGTKLTTQTVDGLIDHDTMTVDPMQFWNNQRLGAFKKSGTAAAAPQAYLDAFRSHLAKAKTLLVFSLPVKASRGTAAAIDQALSDLTPEERERVVGPVILFGGGMCLALRALELIASKQVESATELKDVIMSMHNSECYLGAAVPTLQGFKDWGRLDELPAKEKGLYSKVISMNLSIGSFSKIYTPDEATPSVAPLKLAFSRRRNIDSLVRLTPEAKQSVFAYDSWVFL